MQETNEAQVPSLGQEDPWRRAWQPTPVFLPGESHGQRSLASYSSYGRKELDMTEEPSHTHTHTHPRWEPVTCSQVGQKLGVTWRPTTCNWHLKQRADLWD